MTLREFALENFAGDLEYRPRRAALYMCLAAAAVSVWIFSSAESKFTVAPLVFALGGVALFGKGIFLFRKSSEGFGLTHQELAVQAKAVTHKLLPSLPAQGAQLLEDFSIGGLLLWPLLVLGRAFDHSWNHPPTRRIFLVGAVLFGVGRLVRFLTTQRDQTS
ncbi:MAG TPA: hypothetical protein VJV74_11125 [Terriglobia bacterium]|nr:hypothetical protein [Terriglobia bacterium]